MNTEKTEIKTGNKIESFDLVKLEEQLRSVKTLADLTGPTGVIQELFKNTIERILGAEQEKMLGYPPHEKETSRRTNGRNGFSKKTFNTTLGPVELDIPRDRLGDFEPKIIKKHQRTDPQLEAQILSFYSRGMTTRDIAAQLGEMYGVEVSADFISSVTDSIMPLVHEWQNRPLCDVYAVVFLDAIFYKIRQEGKIVSKASYTVLGVNLEGEVDVLGLWVGEKEGVHFWNSVLVDLKNRGVKDILIASVDGLNGFPEAIQSHYPKADVQLCIVHQIRSSLRYVSSKQRKAFMKDLKEVYKAPTLEVAEFNLKTLSENWRSKYPAAIDGWLKNWDRLSTFFNYPLEIRSMIYTTNAVEALHRCFRKITRSKSVFPTDDSLKKILYLATRNLKGAFKSKRNWAIIRGHLKMLFEDRILERD